MNLKISLILLFFYSFISFFLAKKRILSLCEGPTKRKAYSHISHYGYSVILWSFLALFISYFIENIIEKYFSENDYAQIFSQISSNGLLVAITTSIFGIIFIRPTFKARQHLEGFWGIVLRVCSLFSIFITFFIVVTILIEAIKFFSLYSPLKFLFGLKWTPATNNFGAVPVFFGTFFITVISMIIAVPIGIFAAIYLTEYSNSVFRNIAKPCIEILAGIPTVVYGYFAALIVGPMIKNMGAALGFNISAESSLSAGIVMGIMIIPFILSISDDALLAVPQNLRDASFGLGATRAETILKVILPAAFPGIMGGILLAISRAIGETMIVTMAAGLLANISLNPFESVTTVTAQLVSLLNGDQEFGSSKTLSAFALAFVLFLLTMMLNIIALTIVKKYKNLYEQSST